GPLSLQLRGRFDAWKLLHDELAAQVSAMGIPIIPPQISSTPAYFYTGMQENPETVNTEGGNSHE
ncbi:MAG: hypothetical protein RR053_07805, partial [Evtepia sp.]